MNARNYSFIQESKTSNIKIAIYFSLLLYVTKNRDLHESSSEIHNINTILGSHLRTPTANKNFPKRTFYFVIKVFNRLLISIKNTSHDINQFRSVLKSFLLINIFYSVEYFTWNYNRDLGSILFYIITFNLNS